jgi:hypothetical protein
MTSTTNLLTRAHLDQFRDEGYFVLDRVLTDEQLELPRGGAQYSIDKLGSFERFLDGGRNVADR